MEDLITDKLQDDFSAETVDDEETVAGWTDEARLALAKRINYFTRRFEMSRITEFERMNKD